MNDTTLIAAIKQKDFAKVEELIKADASGFRQLKNYEQESLVQTALRNRAFPLIIALVDGGLVTTDLLDLDNWVGSFIWTVLLQTPFTKTANAIRNPRATHTVEDPGELDTESLDFFQSIATKIENIDEPVENQTLLELAISNNLPIPVLQLIVDSGCPADTYDASENTLLFRRLTPQVGQWLVEQGLDVNHKNKGQVTPLEKAIDAGSDDWVRVLLNNGADLHHKNKEGNSMFRFALVDKLAYETFDLLCEYDVPDFHQTNQAGSSLLFDYIDRMSSVGEKQIQYLEKLLEMGGDLQQVNTTVYGQEKTPEDVAIAKDIAVFETVLDHHTADINQPDNDGNTLLHKVCAVELNHDQNKAKELYRKVKLLLGKGADSSLRNSQDKTAMDLAANDNLKEKTVALLIKSN